MTRSWSTPAFSLLLAAIGVGVVLRAGMTRAWIEEMTSDRPSRPVQVRVWDWWSASANEEYGEYFGDLEDTFEQLHPDIDIKYQSVPFSNYVQKLSAAMVGPTTTTPDPCSRAGPMAPSTATTFASTRLRTGITSAAWPASGRSSPKIRAA